MLNFLMKRPTGVIQLRLLLLEFRSRHGIEIGDVGEDVVGALAHRPELIKREPPAGETQPVLLEEDGPFRRRLDEDGHDEKKRRQDEYSQPRGREIEEPLDEKLPLLGVGRLEVKEGQAVELADG